MLSSAGYWIFSHPEICSGDQSRISLLATTFRTFAQKFYMRWCCIDRLSWHAEPDISNNVGPVKHFLSRLLPSLKRVFPSVSLLGAFFLALTTSARS
jgi:hypothetical protein